MKITFIVPPAFDGKKPAERSAGCTRIVYPMPNIYELTVAAILEQENHTVSYLDFVMKESNKSEFEQTIAEYSTDIFCIWSVNLAIETDKIAATIIRKYHSKTPILFMGPGPTYFYKEYLFDTKIIVIRGEPELITRELVQAISDNKSFNAINGLSYLSEDGKIITNPSAGIIENLDSLPIPSRHLLEGHIYRNPKIKVSPYMTIVSVLPTIASAHPPIC